VKKLRFVYASLYYWYNAGEEVETAVEEGHRNDISTLVASGPLKFMDLRCSAPERPLRYLFRIYNNAEGRSPVVEVLLQSEL